MYLMAPETERIPDDVVEEILVRLPVKSLIRFRCVSRSWSSKIANPIFIAKHFNHNNNNNGFLLCMSYGGTGGRELCAVVCNSDGSLTEISRFGIPFDFEIFIDFCNGIFCSTLSPTFSDKRIDRDPRICLWNPSIRKFKIIEHDDKGFDAVVHGLTFHSQNNDVKVLRFGRFIKYGVPSSEGLLAQVPSSEGLLSQVPSSEGLLSQVPSSEGLLAQVPSSEGLLAQVYTLSIDSWSCLELQDITLIGTPHLFFNGALHSIAFSRDYRKLILCFDVHDHNFREIMLPQDYPNGLAIEFERLAVFKGSLALIAFGLYKDEDKDEFEKVCCIWAMREYGLVSSWTRTNVVPLPGVANFFGCTGSGQLVITKSINNQLFSFDPDSRNEINLGLEDLAHSDEIVPLVYIPNLIESLVLLNE